MALNDNLENFLQKAKQAETEGDAEQAAEFYEQVRQAYRQLAVRESQRVVLIDAAHTADTVEDQIWTTLISRFPALMKKSAIRNPQSAI